MRILLRLVAMCVALAFLTACTESPTRSQQSQQSQGNVASTPPPQTVSVPSAPPPPPPQTASVPSPSPKEPNPLQSFKEVVARLRKELATLSEKPLVYRTAIASTEPERAWSKEQIHAESPRYDVKQTNSLVSPYTAEVLLPFHLSYFGGWPTQQEAKAASTATLLTDRELKIEYAFQDGCWVVTQIQEKGWDDNWREVGAKLGIMPEICAAVHRSVTAMPGAPQ